MARSFNWYIRDKENGKPLAGILGQAIDNATGAVAAATLSATSGLLAFTGLADGATYTYMALVPGDIRALDERTTQTLPAHSHPQYTLKTSDNRPGPTKLFRRDEDSGYSVQTYWDGSRWQLMGYQPDGTTVHAACRVGYADAAGSATRNSNNLYPVGDAYNNSPAVKIAYNYNNLGSRAPGVHTVDVNLGVGYASVAHWVVFCSVTESNYGSLGGAIFKTYDYVPIDGNTVRVRFENTYGQALNCWLKWIAIGT